MLGEYVDLYDENKQFIGNKVFREKGKRAKIPKGFRNIVVICFMENSKGEFLFQMVSKEKGSIWATTGGHVKSGETSLDGIINEIKEELDLDILPGELTLFKTYKEEYSFRDVYYLKKDIDISKLKYQEQEVSYVKYLTKDEIFNLIDNNMLRKTNITRVWLCSNFWTPRPSCCR